ncbi:hypothetical protein [Endozoicomonas sp. YOMI1]|nr:hypothetical protein [Endozoicomonas sp. YOMI1]
MACWLLGVGVGRKSFYRPLYRSLWWLAYGPVTFVYALTFGFLKINKA